MSIIHKSGEDYLETILILQRQTGHVHAIDVAGELGFSKPSVSKALGLLKKSGHVCVSSEGHITLTDAGHKAAAAVYERHVLLRRFLVDVLSVSPETAEIDACKVEHMLSAESVDKLKIFMQSREKSANEKQHSTE
jgi:Mn-dependent DtxR family transcriptional regulator